MASLRRRRTMQLLLAAVAVLVLSAVAVTSAGAGKRDQVTLEIWSPENRAEDGQAHAWLISQFQKENPGIDVKYTITSWDDHFNKIQAAAAAHNLPDIMYSWQPNTLS